MTSAAHEPQLFNVKVLYKTTDLQSPSLWPSLGVMLLMTHSDSPNEAFFYSLDVSANTHFASLYFSRLYSVLQ